MTAPDSKALWRSYEADRPEPGTKFVAVCNDGCSSGLALMTDDGPLNGEDGCNYEDCGFFRGAIWMPLPDDYPLAFMEYHDDH